MAYAGAMVVRGRSSGVVVATGANSLVGLLALDMLKGSGGKPPLVVRMERFTKRIAMLVLAAAGLIAVTGVLLGGYSITEMFLFGVALAVSAIPEGLPVALTVALAIGATRMAHRGVIIRQLAAVEGLGSCTLIASDKTGTLTCNQLTVNEVRLPDGTRYEVTGQGFVPKGQVLFNGKPLSRDQADRLAGLARASVLCNEAELHHQESEYVWRGDPTDVAMLTMAAKLGWTREDVLEEWPQFNSIPFEPERQYAATYHRAANDARVFVKGAPERIFEMLADDEPTLARLGTMANEMARSGYRVLALAEGPAPANVDAHVAPPEPAGVRCLGLGRDDRSTPRRRRRGNRRCAASRCQDHNGHG